MRFLKVCLLVLSLLLVVVEVCYGGLNLELIATMTGENEGDALGGVVAGLGDINGDGYDDVAVRTKSKVVYIYWGSEDFDTIPDVILDDNEMDSGFGRSIACAGDVNGDSISDIIVGASRYNSQTGRAYLYFLSFRQSLSRNLLKISNGFPLTACGNDKFGQTLILI